MASGRPGRELLAAPPRDHVLLAALLLEEAGHVAQGGVAGVVWRQHAIGRRGSAKCPDALRDKPESRIVTMPRDR